MARQPVPNRSAPVRNPPTTGPPTAASSITGPNAPKAAPISLGGNICRMRPSPCGTTMAAKVPCAPREAISISAEPDAAHRAEQTVKPAVPMRNIRLRPAMSPSRAPVIMSTAKARV
jgi:hypothetical protein